MRSRQVGSDEPLVSSAMDELSVRSERRIRLGHLVALLRPHAGMGVLIITSAFLTGLIEASFLVVVTRSALAIANGDPHFATVGGASLSVSAGLVIGAVLVLLRLVVAYVSASASASFVAAVSSEQRRRLTDAFVQASWDTQQAESAGRLQQLLTAFVLQIAGLVGATAATVIALVSLGALLGVSIAVQPLAAAAVFVAVAILTALLVPMRRRLRQRARAAQQVFLAFGDMVAEFGGLGLEMQTFGVSGAFGDRINELSRDDVTARRRVALLLNTTPVIFSTMAYLSLVGALAVVILLGAQGLASISAVLILMLRSLSYGQQLQSSWVTTVALLPALDELETTVARYSDRPAAIGTRIADRVAGLAARDVEFEYRPGEPVLHRLSFEIEPGESVGVVGPSGSGKSTLVQLLLGVRSPTRGVILAGDIDLDEVDRAWWSSRVAFVPQEARLFSGTIAENVAFFRSGMDRAQIESACRRAHVADEIEALPDGYDTLVGSGGGRLSGGQRQRLVIARALVGDPEVLILDEPTSALDVHSEVSIREMLAELRGSVMVIAIAHRMSTLEACQRIMVIQDGHLRGFDTPSALEASGGFYQEALALSGLR
jgi:ATP-binding cassette subfamily B protein